MRYQVAGNQGRAVGSLLPVNLSRLSRSQSSGSGRASFSSFTTVGSELLVAEQLGYCGYGAKYEDILIKGDSNDLKYLVTC